MKSNEQKKIAFMMDKQALRVFGVLAAMVYLCALFYCYDTNHFFEVTLLGIVMLVLGFFIWWMFKD